MKNHFTGIIAAFAAAAVMLAAASAARAQPGLPTPPLLDGARVVISEQAERHIGDENAVFLDARSTREYDRGHIKGAAAAPFEPEFRDRFGQIHPDRNYKELYKLRFRVNVTIVVYGSDMFDWRAYYAAASLVEEGFSRVRWLREGYNMWEFKGMPTEKTE